MYCFPKIKFNEAIIKKAKQEGVEPDVFYSIELLKQTGIVSVAGSGFVQQPGTYHLRLTNLITPTERYIKTLDIFEEFNENFFKQYQ